MIYKITIVNANPAAGRTTLYAHPHWEHPLSEDGDRATAYKVVFHIEEGAMRTHEMRPMVFKATPFFHTNNIYFQLPDAETSKSFVNPASTHVLKVEKKSMCEGEDLELLDGGEEVPLTIKD